MPFLLSPLDIMPPIPVGLNHPGAFGVDRHHDVHTGVDLYTPYGCPVKAIESGKVIKVDWFTGPSINMPWWNDTRAVYIEGDLGVFNYGEIFEYSSIKVGQKIEQGEYFGYVVPVLKRYKGRPMSMLHLELYDHGYVDNWGKWVMGTPKPKHLKNPTPFLLGMGDSKIITEDPYYNCSNEYKMEYL